MIEKIIKNNTDVFLRITGLQYECARYMPKMLEQSICSYFLPLRYQSTNELIYDTMYGQCIDEYIQNKGYTNEFLNMLVVELRNLLKVSASFLLDDEHIVINSEYIYLYKNNRFGFIFNPYQKQNPVAALKELVLKFAADNYIPDSVVCACKEQKTGIDEIIHAFNVNEHTDADKAQTHESVAVLKNILDIDDCISIGEKDVKIGKIKFLNDKTIFASNISLRHASIRYADGDVYVKDCKSKHGTFVNGTGITGTSYVKVEKGDIIAFADHEYIVVPSD